MTVARDTARLRRLDLAVVAAGDPGALADRDALIRRGATPDPTVREAVRRTLADVRERGGAAVRDASHRVGGGRPDVWVTVRTGSAPSDFSANLRAPILIADGRGHQVINEASDAPVRAPLFAGDVVEAAA